LKRRDEGQRPTLRLKVSLGVGNRSAISREGRTGERRYAAMVYFTRWPPTV